jgi:large subunit ribosomal protein L13
MNHKNKTVMVRKQDVNQKKIVLDAAGKTLGRFAAEVSKILRGRHKVNYTPNVDMGDGVIVINASQIVVTGEKEARKIYRYYTGYMGGMREVPYRVMMARHPQYAVEHAVKGMMPKTRLGKQQLKKLRVHAGADHGMPTQNLLAANI